jgi:hypothetical protein
MTKIAIISGLNDNMGQSVPDSMPFLNPLVFTQGEFDLMIAKQRLWLYNILMPQKAKTWAKGANQIDYFLYKGVHGFTPYIGSVPKELKFVAKLIKDAPKRYKNAGEVIFRDVTKLRDGLDLDSLQGLDDWQNVFPKCQEYGYWSGYGGANGTGGWVQTGVDMDCQMMHNRVIQLNDAFPKSAHHWIYQFINENDANNPKITSQTAASKSVLHKNVNGMINNVWRVPTDSLVSWQRNCIVWHNSLNGSNGLLTPEQSIEFIKANPNFRMKEWDGKSIDEIGLPFLAVLIPVVKCLVAAVVAVTGLIQVVKDREPTALQTLSGFGNWSFGADGADYAGFGDNGNGNNGSGDNGNGNNGNGNNGGGDNGNGNNDNGNNGGGDNGKGNNNNGNNGGGSSNMTPLVIGGAALALLAISSKK